MELVVKVALCGITARIDKLYDYKLKTNEEAESFLGRRVLVPFGRANRTLEAYILALGSETKNGRALKYVKEILDKEPVLGQEQLALSEKMRERYLCSYSDVLRLWAPPGASVSIEKWVRLCEKVEPAVEKAIKKSKRKQKIVDALKEEGGPLTVDYLSSLCESNISAVLSQLAQDGIIAIEEMDAQRMRHKMVRFVRLNQDVSEVRQVMESMAKNSYVQKRMLELLCENETLPAADLVAASHGSYSAISSLCQKELVVCYDEKVERRTYDNSKVSVRTMPTLSPMQQAAADRIIHAMDEKEPHAFLLHGVTGSGKTEVFMTAAHHALSRGQSVLILVSEISLTPQLTQRFLERFGSQVAILHSRLSLGERYDEWNRIKAGRARVIIGARSAIFAPCSRLGLIVMDEEHETSYKSESIPRYHARDIAFMRAKWHKASVVMASATPSVESYYLAQKGIYELLELSERYQGANLPQVEICDMTQEMKNGNSSLFSERLREEMAQNLARGEQTILFLNRRGFSGFVSCRSCGYVPKCPHCSISLTYHKADNSLVCHYCGYRVKNYDVCPSCYSRYIRYFGAGTQRVEEEVHEMFPEASVLRMDVDTTSKKGGHAVILEKFEREHVDILIGTQMVAKGLDFENVTLVGIIAADIGLNVDDFRAAERTFGVLTQVAGRAGRGKKAGRSIIQTYHPEEPAIVYAKDQNYVGFFKQEILMRWAMLYPPFCRMVNLTVSSVMEQAAHQAAQQIRKEILSLRTSLKQEQNILQLLGPVQSSVFKVGNKYRFRLIIKCRSAEKLTPLLKKVQTMHLEEPAYQYVSLSIDKNPY